MTVAACDRVAAVAARTPGATALVAACGTLTYGALDARATQLARHLEAIGVGAETLVAVCVERSFDQIIAVLAVWKAGGAYLPLDPAWPAERLRTLAADARCGAVLCGDDLAAPFADAGCSLVLLDRDAAAIAAQPPTPLAPQPAGRLAYVIYTSGSTGAPKGVEIEHGNLAHLVDWHLDAFAVTAGDRAAHLAGLGFDAAIWEIWPYLAAGATVALVPDPARTSPALLRDWLLAHRISIAFAPTAIAEQLARLDWPEGCALRILLTGADVLHACPPEGLPFVLVNNYGPTECTVVATSAAVPPRGAAAGLPPIGRPIANTTVHILDGAGRPVAAGETGELHIGGGGVGRGYRGRPDLTAERFVADPFSTTAAARLYRTGDLGSLRDDGQIAFHGRVDDQVKIRGHRVEPEEIASMLGRHPAVAAAAVAARGDDADEAQLVAWLVLSPGRAATAGEVRDFLAERLPAYMVPGRFARLDALPLTANGKLDRAALPAPDAANALDGAGFAAAETPAEELLVAILGEVLGRPGTVGLDDNFFLLGGHSLLGTQVVLRASEAFGVELTLRHLFQAPTVRQLAALIEGLVLSMIEAMSDDEAQLRAAG